MLRSSRRVQGFCTPQVSDVYREFAYHGGIAESYFTPGLKGSMSFTSTRVEDFAGLASEHYLFDDYWRNKIA